MEAYAALISSYERANVIGTRDFRAVVLDHVLDSLSCLLVEPLLEADRLIDVGSGGGLPGVPLAIACPSLQAVLAESIGKKARFLEEASARVPVDNLRVANGRVEELARTADYRGSFDIATARAVARLAVVAEYCVPFVGVGGCVISMKARLDAEELSEGRRAAKKLGASVSHVVPVPFIPEVWGKERNLVVFEKVRPTPDLYPRSVGVPAKKPLGVV